jgi:hypothetical protein
VTIDELVQPKQKAKVAQFSTFVLRFDNLNLEFVPLNSVVKTEFMAADGTERETKGIPITDMPFTQQERDTVETIFARNVTQMLSDTGFTVQPDQEI